MTTASPSRITHSKSSRRIAEVAGGTAAECAAVCCCCPCATIHLLVAIVKFPAHLCRRALRKKGRHRRAKLLQPKMSEEDEEKWVRTCITAGTWPEKSPSRMVSDMEQELLDAFCNTGFGRSPSPRSSRSNQ